jgi:hypothetical protein
MNAAQLSDRAREIHPWGVPGLLLMFCVIAVVLFCLTEIGASLWNWAGDLRRRKLNHTAADKVLLPPLLKEMQAGLAAIGATERPIEHYLRRGPQDQSLAERTLYCVAQLEFLRRTEKEILNADARLTAALKGNHAQLGRAQLLQQLKQMRSAAHSGQHQALDSLMPRAVG